jgi:hypothetical protein
MKIKAGDYVSLDMGDWEIEWHAAYVLNVESVGLEVDDPIYKTFALGDNDDVEEKNPVNLWVAIVRFLEYPEGYHSFQSLLSYDGETWILACDPMENVLVEPIKSDLLAAVAEVQRLGIELKH